MSKHVILQECLVWDAAHGPSEGGQVMYFDPKWLTPPHFHGQLEVLVVTRGRLQAQIGAGLFDVEAPALVWQLPAIAHSLRSYSDDLAFWVGMFEPDFVTRVLCSGVLDTGVFDERGAASHNDVPPFSSWMEKVANMVAMHPVVEISRRDAWHLDELCGHAWQAHFGGNLRSALEKLLTHIWQTTKREAEHRPLSLAQLGASLVLSTPQADRSWVCRELLVSPSFLARSFRAELGISYIDLRARARVVALLALARRRANLMSAALEAGFGSYSQAHRVFGALTGCRPNDYVRGGGREEIAIVKV